MRITLESNPSNAPGCLLIVADNGKDLLIQTDWDFPGIASTFGWSLSTVKSPDGQECDHSGTDGTIACPKCGLGAGVFIYAARQWLDDNDGATADDPGYFE